MYIIYWDYKSYTGNKYVTSDKDEANNVWNQLRLSGATNMRHETNEPAKRKVVRCKFSNYGKTYTYLCKEKVEVGSHVVVWTTDGRQIVTVVEYGEMTDAELAKICPLDRFKYIEGKVVAA